VFTLYWVSFFCLFFLDNRSLHFLKQLKRSGAVRNDLLCFYGAVIRPVLEYACPFWHSGITAAQSKALESIQRTTILIIFAHDDYMLSLILARLDTLETRRAQLTERFFRRSVLCEESCLHYLLPDKRDSSVTDRLHHAKTFESIPARTNTFLNSFLPYCSTVCNTLIRPIVASHFIDLTNKYCGFLCFYCGLMILICICFFLNIALC